MTQKELRILAMEIPLIAAIVEKLDAKFLRIDEDFASDKPIPLESEPPIDL